MPSTLVRHTRPALALGALLATALLTACSHTPFDPLAPGAVAQAQLQPTLASKVQGQVRFSTQKDGSVRVQGEVQGLAPNSEHGFHIHEKGDCSAPDATSAGGHFNPGGSAHGHMGHGHAGDLYSLQADANGTARFDYSTRSITVGQGINNIIGRGLIVHQDADDFVSQPTGNAGARLACAVITAVK